MIIYKSLLSTLTVIPEPLIIALIEVITFRIKAKIESVYLNTISFCPILEMLRPITQTITQIIQLTIRGFS